MTSHPRRGRHRLPRRRLGAGLLAAAVLAIGGGVTVAALGSDPAPAHADALCDQMRAQYGSNWPCISVPTNTFQPTTSTPYVPTTGATGNSGPQVGSNIGPGPGEGNGTPIVTVPGQAAPQPPAVGDGNGGSGPATTSGTRPTAPQPGPTGDDAGQIPAVPSTTAPAATTAPGALTTKPPAGDSPHALDAGSNSTQPEIPLAAWVVAGAAAFAAANPRVRRAALRARSSGSGSRGWSLLPRGGSERATIGPSQLVLINDPTSPKSYVFHEDVPPGGHIGVNPDGSATIYDATGNPVRQIAKPWAYDALGRPQKTWYTVDENGNLVQHVQPSPDAVYPIIADPTDASSLGQCTPDDPDGNGIAGYQPPQQPQTSTSTANPDGSVTTNTTDGHGGTITSTSTPVPDSGGTVDTTINNADGTTTQTRSVPDGQGGVTTWTANPDGSNSVVYPDGTVYTEPGSSNQGYGVSTPTGDGGVHTDYTLNRPGSVGGSRTCEGWRAWQHHASTVRNSRTGPPGWHVKRDEIPIRREVRSSGSPISSESIPRRCAIGFVRPRSTAGSARAPRVRTLTASRRWSGRTVNCGERTRS